MAAHWNHLSLIVVLSAVAASSVVSGPKRELRAFEDGGTIEFTLRDDSPNSRPSAKVRQFLWTHWITKRRGTIREVGYSIEGTSSERSFFIEPDQKGTWRIAAETKYPDVRAPGDWEEKTSSYEAYSVKRVRPGKEEPALRPVIPKGARVSARSYRLMLIDQGGNVITEL
jgi:hypothetical protein